MKKLLFAIFLFMPLLLAASKSKESGENDKALALLLGKWELKEEITDISWEPVTNEHLLRMFGDHTEIKTTQAREYDGFHMVFTKDYHLRIYDNDGLMSEDSFVLKEDKIIHTNSRNKTDSIRYEIRNEQQLVIFHNMDTKEKFIDEIRAEIEGYTWLTEENGESIYIDTDEVVSQMVFKTATVYILFQRAEEEELL